MIKHCLTLSYLSWNPILFTGGGVLAHTILGVDFNDQTGDVRLVRGVQPAIFDSLVTGF